MKKWNWALFVVIICVCCIGALGNKNTPDIKSAFILASVFGIPLGLFMAWLTKDDE